MKEIRYYICEFCLSEYETKSQHNKHQCCRKCWSIAAHFSMSQTNLSKRSFYESKRIPINLNRIALIDKDLTSTKFGYNAFDLTTGSRKYVCISCEYCRRIFDIRFFRISMMKSVSCSDCAGISRSHVDEKISKQDWYRRSRPNIKFSDEDSNLTLAKYGYPPHNLKSHSNKYIITHCHYCKNEMRCRISDYSYKIGKICCRKCMRLKTVETLNSRYGVSNTLDIPHVKKKFEFSLIEEITSLVLKDHYNQEYISQYSVGPYSFDFFVESKGLLIECQGDYFHAFHLNGKLGNRQDKAKSSFISNRTQFKLISIWEHEIHAGKITDILNEFFPPELTLSINGQCLSPKFISSVEARSFLSRYSTINFVTPNLDYVGLFSNQKLAAVFIFGSLNRNRSNSSDWNNLIVEKVSEYQELRKVCFHPNFVDVKDSVFHQVFDFYRIIHPNSKKILTFCNELDRSDRLISNSSAWTPLGGTKVVSVYRKPNGSCMLESVAFDMVSRSKVPISDFISGMKKDSAGQRIFTYSFPVR